MQSAVLCVVLSLAGSTNAAQLIMIHSHYGFPISACVIKRDPVLERRTWILDDAALEEERKHLGECLSH